MMQSLIETASQLNHRSNTNNDTNQSHNSTNNSWTPILFCTTYTSVTVLLENTPDFRASQVPFVTQRQLERHEHWAWFLRRLCYGWLELELGLLDSELFPKLCKPCCSCGTKGSKRVWETQVHTQISKTVPQGAGTKTRYLFTLRPQPNTHI